MKKVLIILLLFLVTGITYGQIYNIKDSVYVFTCQGTFTDAGGTGGNYSPNEFYQLTMCSSSATNTYSKVYFNSFDVHASDTLYIYDGMSSADPLIGKFNNNNGLTLTPIWATITNMTGCLTFMFISNGANQGAGWNADIYCIEPCQKVLSGIDSAATLPHPDSNYINICFHDTITFTAQGSYPQNDFAYHQSDNTSHFYWNFGDNTIDSGLVVHHVYDSVRGYDVTLKVVDQRGCVSMNSVGLRVRVAGNPIVHIFPPAPICANTQLTLNVGYNSGSMVTVNPISHHQASSLRYDSATFIPDGGSISGGQCYNTNVTFNCFNPGQTVTQASDIVSVCMNIEHSFMGDLEIKLICPNGQSAIMKKFINQGGVYLGQPAGGANDASMDCISPCLVLPCLTNPACNPPGTGWTYCWSMTPTYDSMNAYLSGMTVVPPLPYSPMLDSGTFKPTKPFNSLIGCPLNGTWNLQVCDFWAADNGWVFWWQLNLDAALLPMAWGYDVYLDHVNYSGSSIVSTTDSSATIHPILPGTYPYMITLTDNFGCHYDTSVNVLVKPIPQPGLGPDTTVCVGTSLNFTASGGGVYHWSTGAATAAISVTPAITTTYIVTVTSLGCTNKDTLTVTVNPMPVANAGPDTAICRGTTITISGSGGLQYHWSTGANTPDISVNPANSKYYFLTVTSYNCSSKDSIFLTVNPMPVPFLGNDTSLCDIDTLWISPGFNFTTYLWADGSGLPSFPATATGTYSVDVLNQFGCHAGDSIHLIFNKKPVISVTGSPLTGCQPLLVNLNSSINPAPSSLLWQFGDGNVSTQSGATHTYYGSGAFTVILKAITGAGCDNTLKLPAYVTVWPKPTANFLASPPMASIIDPRILFANYSEYAQSYFWDFGDGTSDVGMSPWHVYSDTGLYIVQLLATSEKGCVDSTRSSVYVRDFYTFYIPNSFSPNGDGMNDFFGPMGTNWGNNSRYEMSIFDRWGEMIFHTTDPYEQWNGRVHNSGSVCPPGVFIYLIKLQPINEDFKKFEGTVMLMK